MIYTLYINNSTNFTLRIVRFTCTSSVMNFIIEKTNAFEITSKKAYFLELLIV